MNERLRFFLVGSLLLAGASISHAIDNSSQDSRSRLGNAPPPTGPFVAWTNEAVLPVDVYGSPTTATETLVYSGGGYSFSAAGMVQNFQKWNPDTNLWTPLAPLPDLLNGMGSMLYGHNGKIYLFGGEDIGTSTVSAATRIYDIATNTWSAGAAMPDVRAFMGAGYYNGSIYLAGGYSTGNVTPAFDQLWRYDIASDTFDTSLASMPAAFGGSGSAVLNGVLYLAGGRDASATTLASLYGYSIAGNSWATLTSMPSPNNVPGAGAFSGRLWIYGGGNPILTSIAAAALPAAPEATTACTAYDPLANSWSACPSLNVARSFLGSTSVRNIPVAVGGYTGSTTNTVEANLGAPELFLDGFESGSTCLWSNAGANYGYTVSTGAVIIPGVTDTGNHVDDGSTLIALPFPYQLYDTVFNNVNVGSNGHLTFGTVSNAYNPGCMPIATATYAAFPYLTDQCTGACLNVTCPTCGIFTSTSGVAPHRIFNIEYRTAYYNSGGAGIPLNYEVRLYEGLRRYDVIYGTVNIFTPPASRTLSAGVQLDIPSGFNTVVGCDSTGGTAPPVAAGEKDSFVACAAP